KKIRLLIVTISSQELLAGLYVSSLALDSRILSQTMLAQLRSPDSPSIVGKAVNLQWVNFNGFVPTGAVSIWNDYTSRTDYVCKVHCEAGFYNLQKGSCFYSYGGKEFHSNSFDILVNLDNFEFLQWVPGLYGSYPLSTVMTCEGYDVLVGKNRYGLGKVVPKSTYFYLPWEGKEYYYKYYDVLSINTDYYSQKLDHVVYDTNQANVLEHLLKQWQISSMDNNECKEVNKTSSIDVITRNGRMWEIQHSAMYGVSINITAGIPSFLYGSVRVSTEKTSTATLGEMSITCNNNSLLFKLFVQPKYSCSVKISVKTVTASILFTARLSRTYWNGRKEQTTVVGKYKGLETEEVIVVAEHCKQIPSTQPCLSV
uniref:Natterin-4 n=1 Tax=Erpetoichthys calabaricus TaxID=27687 RepID=A0A8C4RWT4_ERPCA